MSKKKAKKKTAKKSQVVQSLSKTRADALKKKTKHLAQTIEDACESAIDIIKGEEGKALSAYLMELDKAIEDEKIKDSLNKIKEAIDNAGRIETEAVVTARMYVSYPADAASSMYGGRVIDPSTSYEDIIPKETRVEIETILEQLNESPDGRPINVTSIEWELDSID